MKPVSRKYLVLLCSLIFHGCEKSPPDATTTPGDAPIAAEDIRELREHSTIMFTEGEQALASALSDAEELRTAIVRFLATPEQSTLSDAQNLWREAILGYRHFYFFHHIGLATPTFERLNRLDYQIASFPIQPGFLDTFGPYKYSGLVHDVGFPLTPESLTQQHGLTDLSEVVLGLYAMEFLLFNVGEERQTEDFYPVESLNEEMRERGFQTLDEAPNNRRRTLLDLQAQLLLKDLKDLQQHWKSAGVDSFQALWQAQPAAQVRNVTRMSLESGLTQIMLELSAMTVEESRDELLSPGINTASFADRQRFMHHALTSISSGSAFLKPSQSALFQEALDAAITLTAADIETPESEEQAHWQSVFASIKTASDVLVKPEKEEIQQDTATESVSEDNS